MVIGVALAAPAVSHADNAPIVVDSPADTDTATTLRNAINQANANAGADTITFNAGLSGDTIHLLSPLPTITGATTITGPGSDQLTIDGSGVSDGGMLNSEVPFPGAAVPVTVSDLTFSNGTDQSAGGAISAFNTALTVNNSVFTGNSGKDGAIRVNPGSVTVDSSTFTDNQSSSYGGAMSAFSAPLTISDSTFTNNSGGQGGALYLSYGPLQITRTTISGNTASGSGGGAALLYPTGAASIRDSTISENRSSANGGGLFLNSVGYTDVYRTQVLNSTISGNRASGQGGGIFSLGGMYRGAPNQPTRQQLDVLSSTIAGNTATGSGGGIQVNGNSEGFASTLQNSAIGCNSTEAPDGADLARSADQNALAASFSLIQNAPAGSFTNAVAGSNIAGQNPLLASLADNGGATDTRLPATNSPLIDKGDTTGGTFDQRGSPHARTFDQPAVTNSSGGDGTDIGAVELQSGETPGTAAACDSHVGPPPAKPAPPQPPPPVVVQTPSVGTVGVKKIRATKNGVSFTVTCTVASCNGRGVLNTVQRMKGRKVTGLLKVHKRRVRVGVKSYSLAAGQTKTITIKVNGKGRKLLRRFKKLPVRLVVSQKQSTGKSQVVKSKKLRIKAARKKR